MSPAELIVDSFAGGGGASLGIELALGRSPDIAINHDRDALAIHLMNHPGSRHYREDVWHVDPVEACAGRPVGLMWLSPDCKHFSKAKGGKPVEKKIRGLAWVAVRWAKAVRPRVIILENVEEFQTWGPLDDATGRPCPNRKGLTFRRFVGRLRNLGYAVEWRELRACDFGAPTIRKRLFLIARCDGAPIVWPTPTHGPHRAQAWHTAAECIDWSIPCPSIFGRKKPLAENTLKRIARGIRRYVLESPRPFIVGIDNASNGGRDAWDSRAPLTTVTAEARHAVVAPYLATYYGAKREGDDRTSDLQAPLPTQPTENRFAVVAPFLKPRYGEDPNPARRGGLGQAPRVRSLEEPAPVIVPTSNGGDLVAAFLAKHFTGVVGSQLDLPMATVTSIDHHSLVTATLENANGSDGSRADARPNGRDSRASGWHGVEAPESEQHAAPCAASAGDAIEEWVPAREGLSGLGAVSRLGSSARVDGPAWSDSARDGAESPERGQDEQRAGEPGARDARGEQPARVPHGAAHSLEDGASTGVAHDSRHRVAVPSGRDELRSDREDAAHRDLDGVADRESAVRAFLVAYYGTEQRTGDLFEPMPTVVSKDRFGLVTVNGAEYVIADIGMRMLVPRELARAQSFPDGYVIEWGIDPDTGARRLMTKTAQVKMIGNSVCPVLAEALVRANVGAEREVLAA